MHVFLRAASGGVSDPPVLREKIPGKVVSPPFFLAVAVLASVIRPSDGNALMDVVVGIGIFLGSGFSDWRFWDFFFCLFYVYEVVGAERIGKTGLGDNQNGVDVLYFILFYFILFYFILFCFVLFCFILFIVCSSVFFLYYC